MSDKRDYYGILGLGKDASEVGVKRAYRKLALKYHPDKNQGNKDAEEKFKEVSEAYEVLSDSRKRATYDQYGHAGMQNAFSGHGFKWSDFTHYDEFGDIFGNLNDFFSGLEGDSDFFGGGGRSSTRRGPRRGSDLQFELKIDFQDAFKGVEHTINIPRYGPCAACDASGAKPGTSKSTCPLCNGRGQVYTSGGFFNIATTCSRCRGEGEVISTPCPKCQGQGRVRATRKIKVKIPAGVHTGNRLRVQGEGESGIRSGLRGDLYVYIVVKTHPLFKREGDDVICEVPINFPSAVFGAEISVPTVDGSVKMKIPEGTQSGKIFRIRGKGMPRLGSYGRGDEFVRVNIETPTNLDQRQRSALKGFAEACGESVTPMTKNFFDSVKKMFK